MNRNEVIELVRGRLFELQDLAYRDFHAKLIPMITMRRIICTGF